MVDSVRVDKWLWAARFYKTRSQATAACQAGKVKVGGQSVKPGQALKIGATITLTRPHFRQTVQVKGLISKRVGAKLAAEAYEDLTPPEELEQVKLARSVDSAFFHRQRGAGRPTKKERRQLEKLRQRS